jgi:hypothetical protein
MDRIFRFSERKGFKSVKNKIQDNFIDSDLKNSLWTALVESYWSYVYFNPHTITSAYDFITKIWIDYFKNPLDSLPSNGPGIITIIRKYFFECPWYEVYDFIEFAANNHEIETTNKSFMERVNYFLEKEVSAYRFVGGKITEITSPEEISEIEEALEKDFLKPVNAHITTALKHLSDRESPDYRNSIKESISAVEALCRIITKNPKATLGDALGEIKKQGKVVLHPALESAFDKLYGYTSDEKGIRHSFYDGVQDIKFEDAKFMLVSCSAFVNYLTVKCSEAGIKL